MRKRHLEMLSQTPETQRRRGFNKLLRAIAVMVAYVEKQSIVSLDVSDNHCSSYTLMREYETYIDWCTELKPPMEQGVAECMCATTSTVSVPATRKNFERACDVVTRLVPDAFGCLVI